MGMNDVWCGGRVLCCSRVAVVLAIVLGFASVVPGTIIEFDLNVVFTGDPPAGVDPWLNAAFTDDAQPAGTVALTLTATNLTGAESVRGWYLNLDRVLDPCFLVFSAVSKTGTFQAPVIQLGLDRFRADGDGFYDILIAFDVSNGTSTRFGVGNVAMYTITYGGAGAFSPSSFDVDSTPHGSGSGRFRSAAQIIAIGTSEEDNSGWIATPEPTSMCLLGLGAILLRKRRRD